ncbi:MAG: jacalin-like lectin [Planctomycetota bacterium]
MKNLLSKLLVPSVALLGMAVPAAAQDTTLVGPAGGNGGDSFGVVIPEGGRIVEFFGRSGSVLDRIGFRWVDAQGNFNTAGPFGGGGGNSFSLPLVGEYFESLQVTAGSKVDQIEICSDAGICTVQGGNGGSTFPAFQLDGFEIVGIHGSAGSVVDSLGVFLRPLPDEPCQFTSIPSGCQDLALAGVDDVLGTTHNFTFSVLGATPGDLLFNLIGQPTDIPLPGNQCKLLVAPILIETKFADGVFDTFQASGQVQSGASFEIQVLAFDGLFFNPSNALNVFCP